MTTGFMEFDIVVRSEITIDAPPEAVWYQLSRLQEWKDSIHSLERIAGQPGEVGEVLKIGQRRGDRIVFVTQKTLETIAPSRKVEYLETEDGKAARGYIIYSMVDQGASTWVCCDLLIRSAVPFERVEGAGVEHMAGQARLATREKLDADHRVLKSMLEKGGTQ